MYLSAIETFICHREIKFKRVYFLRFCTKYDTRFMKYCNELLVALSSTNAKKKVNNVHFFSYGVAICILYDH